MVFFSLGEAAERIGTSKADIWRAIKDGSLAANRTGDGGFAIDEPELFRVFKPQCTAAEQPPAAEASPPGNSIPTDTPPPEGPPQEIAVAFAALEAEMKGLLAQAGNSLAQS